MKRMTVVACVGLALAVAAPSSAGAFPEQPSERGQGRACEALPNAPGQDRVNEVRPEEVSARLTLQFVDACLGGP